MKTINYYYLSAILLSILLFVNGCIPSSRTVDTMKDLREAQRKDQPIRILTADSRIYTLNPYYLNGNSISGNGTVEYKNDKKGFSGEIPYSDIELIERLKPNLGQGFWIIPASLAITGGLVTLMEPQEFTIERIEGSCPFIYAYDGTDYKLEAESFSTSISKALEGQTYHHLPSLKPVDNKLKIRVANERPETHIFNSMELFMVDALDASSIVLDVNNKVWPVYYEQAPRSASDHSGKNVLETVATKDHEFWETDFKSANVELEFQDELTLTFDLPANTENATLIINAINSDLINDMYSAAGAIIGNKALDFYHTLESDSELKNFFLKWIERSSLLIEILTEEGWEKAGSLRPEANEVPFRRAIRLKNLSEKTSLLTIKPSSLTDVWHIDAVSIENSSTKPLNMINADLLSITSSNNYKGVRQAISENDSSYTIILPPDYLDLEFDAEKSLSMQNPQYIFSARGYLYEWFPQTNNSVNSRFSEWFDDVAPHNKRELFDQYEDIFLYAIYNNRIKEARN